MLTPEQIERIDHLVKNYRPNSVTEADLAEALDFTKPLPPSPPPPTSWRDQPATEKQIKYLYALGINPSPKITKGEASDLIESRQRA